MASLVVNQKKIEDLFNDNKADFLIPDYQRPYAWTEVECGTLWDDIFSFVIPEDGKKFDVAEEYFLGPIVTFKNEKGKQEIIDGQQRLTTLMLLLRVIYKKLETTSDLNAIEVFNRVGKCIWKKDEIGFVNKDELKIVSEVATDADKEEFAKILGLSSKVCN